MRRRILAHIKGNTVAYLALFVALGGASGGRAPPTLSPCSAWSSFRDAEAARVSAERPPELGAAGRSTLAMWLIQFSTSNVYLGCNINGPSASCSSPGAATIPAGDGSGSLSTRATTVPGAVRTSTSASAPARRAEPG